MFSNDIVQNIQEGKIGVVPTDTLYGLVGSALLPATVERIYSVRHRNAKKPLIILLGDMNEVKKFGIELSSKDKQILEKVWPGKVSVILSCPDAEWEYLHRGTQTLAFRVPDNRELSVFLKQVGPLVAPSVNREGEKPAETIEEARQYFGTLVDFYVDDGKKAGEPSTLISLSQGKVTLLRQGAAILPPDRI